MVGRLRDALREIRLHAGEPHWWKSRYEHRLVASVQQRLYGNEGIKVTDRDWDNLIVLDACRTDLFEEVLGTGQFDQYERVRSLGGSTPEWVQRNFVGEQFGDIVYVSGNPQVSKYAGDAFHDLIEVWDGQFDDEHRTVLPEDMTEAALAASERYPNKRLIIHYMQPHTPFLDRESMFPANHNVTKELIDASKEELKTMIDEVGRENVWAAYRRTLEIAADPVERLVSGLSGKTVLSSDHGELFGERTPPFYTRLYGHKTGIRYPKLVDVPWAVVEGDRRRQIVDERTTHTQSDSDKIEERLTMLGYK